MLKEQIGIFLIGVFVGTILGILGTLFIINSK